MTKSNTLFAAAGAAALSVLAFSAVARPSAVSDMQYVQAERCQALMSSNALGKQDTQGIDAFLRQQGASRTQAAYDMGQSAHDRAAFEANHSGDYAKSRLIAERDGACRTLLAGDAGAGSAGAGSR